MHTLILLSLFAAPVCERRHVVLICGDKAEHGFTEFWCDTARMYNLFRASKVADEDIHVLYGDGTDWKCPQNPAHNHPNNVTDHAAMVANVTAVFEELASSVDVNDKLIVWTFDHGASDGALCLMDGYLSPDTLAGLVSQIHCRSKVFMMQQCFSGDFVEPLTNGAVNTMVLTAAGHELAYPANDPWENNNPCRTGEFNYYLMNAMEGASPHGVDLTVCDVNGDGHCSCIEVKYNVFPGDGQPNPGGEGTLDPCQGMDTFSTPQYRATSSTMDAELLTGEPKPTSSCCAVHCRRLWRCRPQSWRVRRVYTGGCTRWGHRR